MTRKQILAELGAKRDALQSIFATFDDGAGGYKEMPQSVIEDIKARNTELGDLATKAAEAETIDDIRKANEVEREAYLKATGIVPFPMKTQDADEEKACKSVGEGFVKSAEYKDFVSGPNGSRGKQQLIVEVKTTMTTGAGWVQATLRSDKHVLTGTRPVRLLDLMPHTSTTRDTMSWMEETTFTNNAAPVAENAQKPESALAYTARTQPCEVIATTLPVTEQQLDADSSMMSLIDNRLALQLELARENEYLNGTGVTPRLLGYLQKPSIQTQAKGADNTPTAILNAITKIRWTGYAEPDAIVMHPNDWVQIRTLQDTTGNFVFGNPAVAGPETVWGMRPVISNLITEGTALVGDFRMYSEAFERWGVRLDVGYVGDDFRYNRRTLRIEVRECLAIYRAEAYCTVTGI